MAGYLPGNDQEFGAWVDNFIAYAAAHHAAIGLSVDDMGTLEPAHPDWDTSLTAHVAAQAGARAATAGKNDARATLEDVLRALVARIQTYPGTTEADLEALGLKSRSLAMATPVPGMAEERPMALIDISARLTHVLRIQTVTATGTKRAKPQGAVGCELWRKVGEAPTGVSDMQLVGLATRSPYVVDYTDADAGKTAHYALRWVNSKGEKSSWSETESATIAA
jgi:hypothetical protein